MNYKIVELDSKTVVGLTARTSNNSVDMSKVIGDLWNKFCNDGYVIDNKKNNYQIGLYSDYKDEEYDITVCCEVTKAENLKDGLCVKNIPSGKYAKFELNGNMMEILRDCWNNLQHTDLKRKYECDFEEYISVDENGNSRIDVYISIL